MVVAESAPQADTRSVCVNRTTVDNTSTFTAPRARLLAIAEPFVQMRGRVPANRLNTAINPQLQFAICAVCSRQRAIKCDFPVQRWVVRFTGKELGYL